jgi:hypothetical protein
MFQKINIAQIWVLHLYFQSAVNHFLIDELYDLDE